MPLQVRIYYLDLHQIDRISPSCLRLIVLGRLLRPLRSKKSHVSIQKSYLGPFVSFINVSDLEQGLILLNASSAPS